MPNIEFNLTPNSSNPSTGLFLPVKILENSLLSNTSEAYVCFTQQKFSANLQTYLVNYVITVSSLYSPYA